jgi:hypothetical protein
VRGAADRLAEGLALVGRERPHLGARLPPDLDTQARVPDQAERAVLERRAVDARERADGEPRRAAPALRDERRHHGLLDLGRVDLIEPQVPELRRDVPGEEVEIVEARALAERGGRLARLPHFDEVGQARDLRRGGRGVTAILPPERRRQLRLRLLLGPVHDTGPVPVLAPPVGPEVPADQELPLASPDDLARAVAPARVLRLRFAPRLHGGAVNGLRHAVSLPRGAQPRPLS